MRVVIAAGGTAGHVNPALALADALDDASITFVGTAAGAEADLVPAAGWPLEKIEVRGFDRARPLSIVATGAVAVRATASAHSILRRIRPDVVVGMGGYVSLPVCISARMLRAPVVVHEQNIVLGLANRIAKIFAARVAVSFEDSLAAGGRRAVVTGNPVSRSLVGLDPAARRPPAVDRLGLARDRKTLLVFGGSLGARRINAAAAGIATMWAARTDVQIFHITGRAGYSDGDAPPHGPAYRSVTFLDDMRDAYAAADVALCRGGATTVAELTAVGLPAIIVPYPHHRDRQQERHGRVLERAGAALLLADADATAERVSETALRILHDDARRARMAAAARALGRADAADRLAGVVREVAA